MILEDQKNMTTQCTLSDRSCGSWLAVNGKPVFVWERYSRYDISLLSILCMLIARMEMRTSRVSGDFDIITLTTEHLLDGNGRVVPIMMI